jgi:hypothetical protein
MHSDKPGIWDDSTLLLSYGLLPPNPPPSTAAPTP